VVLFGGQAVAATSNAGLLRSGFWVTLELVALSFMLALAMGFVMASFRVSPLAPLRWLGTVYVEYFRNTPLLILMLIFFAGFAKISLQLSNFTASILALGLYTGAFVTEALRSGINAVDRGQVEAARSLGLSFVQMLRLVVLPQAFRTVVPPLGNLFIACIKNSAIAEVISVSELSFQGDLIISREAKPVLYGLVVAVGYLMLTIPAGVAVNWLERQVAIRR
jgi:glutamate transport system permease protein